MRTGGRRDGETDRQTGMTKLKVVFRNFAKSVEKTVNLGGYQI